MHLRRSIGNRSMNHPKSMFQLSGVHYRGLRFRGLGFNCEFPKIRGTLVGGLDNKDPTI